MQKSFILLCFVLCFLALFSTCIASSVPILVWSPLNLLGGTQQYSNTLENRDVEKLLQTSVGVQSSIESSIDPLLQSLQTQHPEVVILFVETNFGSEQLAKLSSAYSRKSDCVFQQLKNSFNSAGSSIVFPYVLGNSLAESLIHVADRLKATQPSASLIFVSSSRDSPALPQLAGSSLFEKQTPDQFLKTLSESPILSNGVTDFVIVSFNQQFVQDDAFLGSVASTVSEKTNGNFVSMFSGLQYIPRVRVTRDADPIVYASGSDCGVTDDPEEDYNCSYYTNYFPIVVFQVMLVSITLMIIACVGIYCTCSLQSPARFEVPKAKRSTDVGM